MSNPIIILNPNQIAQKITRIAYQIWEDNIDEKEIVLAGIIDYGYTIAERLKKELESISDIRVQLIKILIDKNNPSNDARAETDVKAGADKVVIVVDDVINSGRTLAFGCSLFLDIPLKKLRTVALVERSHRVFPVSPDFVGTRLATVIKEHVDVVLNAVDSSKDGVFLH